MHLTTILQRGLVLPIVLTATASPDRTRGNHLRTVSSDLPSCVIAANWVRSHPNELPASIAELSYFSLSYRRAIYVALPIATQEQLWREQLTSFLTMPGVFSAAQRDWLREAVELLPLIFDPKKSTEHRREVAVNFFNSTAFVFEDDQRRAVFIRLGSVEPPWAFGRNSGKSASNLKSSWISAAGFSFLSSAALGGCECSLDWPTMDCQIHECRPSGNPHCDLTEQGCGPFAQVSCDGNCDGGTGALRASVVKALSN